MNREKEKEIAGIIEKHRPGEHYEIGYNVFKNSTLPKILSLFPIYKVKIDCPECGGNSATLCRKGKCDNYYYDIGAGCGMDSAFGDCPAEKCSTCKGNKTILKDLAHGITGEIIEVKGE